MEKDEELVEDNLGDGLNVGVVGIEEGVLKRAVPEQRFSALISGKPTSCRQFSFSTNTQHHSDHTFALHRGISVTRQSIAMLINVNYFDFRYVSTR